MKKDAPKQKVRFVQIEPVLDLFDDGRHVKTAFLGTHQNLVIGAAIGRGYQDTVSDWDSDPRMCRTAT
jgi:hypothetical protein